MMVVIYYYFEKSNDKLLKFHIITFSYFEISAPFYMLPFIKHHILKFQNEISAREHIRGFYVFIYLFIYLFIYSFYLTIYKCHTYIHKNSVYAY